MKARPAGAIAAGAALFLLSLLFGAFAADPVRVVAGADRFLLRRHGALTERFRSRADGTLLSVVELGKLSANALATDATVRKTRHTVMTRVLPSTSATGPSTGCSTA